jgi:hypothetical protein
MVQSIKIG